ncbi:helix-turn-helix transcriptional regulator [Streptomyces carpaticus]|uniref:helix-turn-helix domain-containing protein n=1 Tax=Streptomyces carpaticus TaxID=285558 RepID=UPI0022023316|nr:helix-turn-helix transcriptional regulator [Streptomyces carpaticus]
MPSAGAARAARQLGAALLELLEQADTTQQEIADSLGLSPSYVSRILSGHRLPGWDTTATLTAKLGGEPRELRMLWEKAWGVTAPTRQSPTRAAERLTAALRGLHLCAGRPSPASLNTQLTRRLSVASIERALAGEEVLDWEKFALLVRALGGLTGDFRPLWEAVHYTYLVCTDGQGGTFHDTLDQNGLDGDGLPPAAAAWR